MDGVVRVGQPNALLEMVALPIELDGLGPIVEGASDEDLGGGMSPTPPSRSLSTAVAESEREEEREGEREREREREKERQRG